MIPLQHSARLLALAILDTPWRKPALTELLSNTLSGGPPNPSTLAARLLFHCGSERSPSFARLLEVLMADPGLRRRFAQSDPEKLGIRWQFQPVTMQPPVSGLVTLPLPRLPTTHDLAMWLGLSDKELAWFAGLNRRCDPGQDPRLHHYHYAWQARIRGHQRLLEKPKPRLKAIQQIILSEILNRVPVHSAAHGFCRGRSCRTSVMPHLNQDLLLRLDFKDFFSSIQRARVAGVFRSLGYPSGVSRSLAGLCTHRTSAHYCGSGMRQLPWETRKLLSDAHLPQGAPTSPALANLCAWRFDARLHGLTQRMGLTYTRYADDLAVSGTIHPRYLAEVVQPLIGAIALEEGFSLNYRKTRTMTRAQRQSFCGITVNMRPNLQRREYDRLKAILFNCVRQGPASQNREQRSGVPQSLPGRVSYASVLNPQRGHQRHALLDQICWAAEPPEPRVV